MTNAEAWFSVALRPQKLYGRGAQDGHLDSHTTPELLKSKPTKTCKTLHLHRQVIYRDDVTLFCLQPGGGGGQDVQDDVRVAGLMAWRQVKVEHHVQPVLPVDTAEHHYTGMGAQSTTLQVWGHRASLYRYGSTEHHCTGMGAESTTVQVWGHRAPLYRYGGTKHRCTGMGAQSTTLQVWGHRASLYRHGVTEHHCAGMGAQSITVQV